MEIKKYICKNCFQEQHSDGMFSRCIFCGSRRFFKAESVHIDRVMTLSDTRREKIKEIFKNTL